MDFDFTSARVLYGARYRAALLSVLLPAFGKKAFAREGQPALAAELRKTWRRFVSRMREAGWPRGDDAKANRRAQYMRNCPPCGLVWDARVKSTPCTCLPFCPYCWSRTKVLEPFTRMAKVLWPDSGDPDDTGPVRYVGESVRELGLEPACYENVDREADFKDRLVAFRRLLRGRANRTREVSNFRDVLGAFVVYGVHYRAGGPPYLRRGAVVLMGEGGARSLEQPPKAAGLAVQVWGRGQGGLTRNLLATAFARAARHPYGWLRGASPVEVDLFARVMWRARWSETYGILREKRNG